MMWHLYCLTGRNSIHLDVKFSLYGKWQAIKNAAEHFLGSPLQVYMSFVIYTAFTYNFKSNPRPYLQQTPLSEFSILKSLLKALGKGCSHQKCSSSKFQFVFSIS